MNKIIIKISMCICFFLSCQVLAVEYHHLTFKPGHPSLQHWILPTLPKAPDDNKITAERILLGKTLFFDPRLSGDKNMSCATCHNPILGWSDGLPTAKGFQSGVLPRATPVIVNTGFNHLQMWDGREKSLESQALGPINNEVEMNADIQEVLAFLQKTKGYQTLFQAAYPDEGVTESTLAKAIATFERTIVSNNSPFDRWIKGEADAMTAQQVEGFKVFVDPKRGKCEVCHSAPNFTDDGFHNLGLASFSKPEPDMGRHNKIPLNLMKGAFKTPTIRDITLSAPYFHDGSAVTLAQVVNHYISGGVVKSNISPNFQPAVLTAAEKAALISFMTALTTPATPVELPPLPLDF